MNKNLRIECPTIDIFNKVMDYLESKGEKISKTSLIYNERVWNYVGYFKVEKKWVAINKTSGGE